MERIRIRYNGVDGLAQRVSVGVSTGYDCRSIWSLPMIRDHYVEMQDVVFDGPVTLDRSGGPTFNTHPLLVVRGPQTEAYRVLARDYVVDLTRGQPRFDRLNMRVEPLTNPWAAIALDGSFPQWKESRTNHAAHPRTNDMVLAMERWVRQQAQAVTTDPVAELLGASR